MSTEKIHVIGTRAGIGALSMSVRVRRMVEIILATRRVVSKGQSEWNMYTAGCSKL
jgi:hypothetical protein